MRRCNLLLLSRALRQSGELFKDKMLRIYRKLGDPVRVVQETALTMTLANGSRIVSLPGDGDTIVGYSGVAMLVIDEAARVPDDLYRMVRPMQAVSQGKLVCLSTPYGKRGFFYEEWQGNNRWHRVRVTAGECPRISREFLDEERAALGDRWYHNVRGIKRFPLGTSYPDIVERVKQTLEKPQYTGAPLVIDGTGVGVPVVDMFRKIGMSARIRPVQIIAGQTEASDPTTGWNKVSKIVLVSTLIALLQSWRIFWADGMPERIVLERELQDYRLKVTKAANETFDAKAGAHDDLVMALVLACWYGERGSRKLRIGA